jgi:hypothetical protein
LIAPAEVPPLIGVLLKTCRLHGCGQQLPSPVPFQSLQAFSRIATGGGNFSEMIGF